MVTLKDMATAARISSVLVALGIAAAITTWGGDSFTVDHPSHKGTGHTESATTLHNSADVAFARNMIPHHQQAVDMSAMVPSHTTNSDMYFIASHIRADQRAEIQSMQALLRQWGEPADAHTAHESHSLMGGDGMVDAATINQLQSLEGAAFDTLWIKSMIDHHRGAVDMAQAEIAHGQNPDAIRLAKLIVAAQQREISYMTTLLNVTQ